MFIWLLEFGIKLQGTVKANICSILKTDNLFFYYLKLFRRICTYAEGLEDTWDYFAQAVTELTVRSCPQLTNAVPFHAIPDPTPMLRQLTVLVQQPPSNTDSIFNLLASFQPDPISEQSSAQEMRKDWPEVQNAVSEEAQENPGGLLILFLSLFFFLPTAPSQGKADGTILPTDMKELHAQTWRSLHEVSTFSKERWFKWLVVLMPIILCSSNRTLKQHLKNAAAS